MEIQEKVYLQSKTHNAVKREVLPIHLNAQSTYKMSPYLFQIQSLCYKHVETLSLVCHQPPGLPAPAAGVQWSQDLLSKCTCAWSKISQKITAL